MASLRVRGIDEAVYERLRIRAAEHGVSMEEEVLQILRRVLAPPALLGSFALSLFGPAGVDLQLLEREPHEDVTPL